MRIVDRSKSAPERLADYEQRVRDRLSATHATDVSSLVERTLIVLLDAARGLYEIVGSHGRDISALAGRLEDLEQRHEALKRQEEQ